MLKTEMRNKKTTHIDKMSTKEMLAIISEENYNATRAVEKALPSIANAVDEITQRLQEGGRLFYVGAGTSGRLGVLDAVECPPTFGVSYDVVIGIIAGGNKCLTQASENEEDKEECGQRDILLYDVCKKDAVVGISVAGGAAYVVGALKAAKAAGAKTIALTSNEHSKIATVAEIEILTDTGAEAVTGSTRMKAGTAHKMVLNMLSTCAMIKTGKVYENMMINLKPSNIKLIERMLRILSCIAGCDEKRSEKALEENGWNIRHAAEMLKGEKL